MATEQQCHSQKRKEGELPAPCTPTPINIWQGHPLLCGAMLSGAFSGCPRAALGGGGRQQEWGQCLVQTAPS